MLRSPGEKMLRGLTAGFSECDTRGNGGEGAAGGHCGLMFEYMHQIEVLSVRSKCSAHRPKQRYNNKGAILKFTLSVGIFKLGYSALSLTRRMRPTLPYHHEA